MYWYFGRVKQKQMQNRQGASAGMCTIYASSRALYCQGRLRLSIGTSGLDPRLTPLVAFTNAPRRPNRRRESARAVFRVKKVPLWLSEESCSLVPWRDAYMARTRLENSHSGIRGRECLCVMSGRGPDDTLQGLVEHDTESAAPSAVMNL